LQIQKIIQEKREKDGGMRDMEDYEKEIVHHLRQGRKTNMSHIARITNSPITTVIDRIKRIEEKYILKHSVILDYKKIGYNSPALLAIKLDHSKHVELLEFLTNQKNVNTILRTNSGYDFLVEIVCTDDFDLKTQIEHMKLKFQMEMMQFNILKVEDKEKFTPLVDKG
jgi:DNA-binding Lrp family transcriptional regulator